MKSDNLIFIVLIFDLNDPLFFFDKSSRSISFDEVVFDELESIIEAAFIEVGNIGKMIGESIGDNSWCKDVQFPRL